LTQREIQSLEVSCFVQATEDEGKLPESVARALGTVTPPGEEVLEGHFGNAIVSLVWKLTGEEAWGSFVSLMALLGADGRRELARELPAHLDEHGALYIRLNKQTMVQGVASLSSSDPIRVRVKPRSFMMNGPPARFYEAILGGKS
jgi:RNA binding exosome subunit